MRSCWSHHVTAANLALFWIWMGVLHFTMHDDTVRMMPSCFWWKDEIVVITGVLELVVALMLLPPKLRHWGAFGTMFLLVYYTPAVVHIVRHDATPLVWPEWERAFFRWGVVPINIGLFVWASVYFKIGTSRT